MKLHIGDLCIDYYTDSHVESVKKLNKQKHANVQINFYVELGEDDEQFNRLKEMCDSGIPEAIITSKANYHWVFEGVKLTEFNHKRRDNKFFDGDMIETILSFTFDRCYGTNDIKVGMRTLQLYKLGL